MGVASTLPGTAIPAIYGDVMGNDVFYNATEGTVRRSGSTIYRSTFCSGTQPGPIAIVTAARCLDVGRRKVRMRSPDTLGIVVAVDVFNDAIH